MLHTQTLDADGILQHAHTDSRIKWKKFRQCRVYSINSSSSSSSSIIDSKQSAPPHGGKRLAKPVYTGVKGGTPRRRRVKDAGSEEGATDLGLVTVVVGQPVNEPLTHPIYICTITPAFRTFGQWTRVALSIHRAFLYISGVTDFWRRASFRKVCCF